MKDKEYYSKHNSENILLAMNKAIDELSEYMRNDRQRYSNIIPYKKIREMRFFDFKKIVNSSYEDYQKFIDEEFNIYTLAKTLGVIMSAGVMDDNILCIKSEEEIKEQIPKYFKDLNDIRTFGVLLSSVITTLDNYYSIFNAITFLIPYKKFDFERLKWGEIERTLSKIDSMGVDTIFFNIENEKGYPEKSWKLTKTDFLETEIIFKEPGEIPEIETIEALKAKTLGAETDYKLKDVQSGKNTHMWRLTRIEKGHLAKEIALFRFLEDIELKRNSFTRAAVEVSEISFRMLGNELGEEGFQQVIDEKNRRYAINSVSNTLDMILRVPLSYIYTQEERDDISFCFQALDVFLNRKRIYKNASNDKNFNNEKEDISLVDIDDNEEEKIMKIKDIVIYENENGIKYHTHHKSPRKHYVSGHIRNGHFVKGYWRGKDGMVYQI